MLNSASVGLSSTNRISTLSNSLDMTCLRCGQSKIERRALAELAFSPDPTAMSRDDALYNGKARAVAGEVGAMQPIEHAEQLASDISCRSRHRYRGRSRLSHLIGHRPYLDFGIGLGAVNFTALSSRHDQTRWIIPASPNALGNGDTSIMSLRPRVRGSSSLERHLDVSAISILTSGHSATTETEELQHAVDLFVQFVRAHRSTPIRRFPSLSSPVECSSSRI